MAAMRSARSVPTRNAALRHESQAEARLDQSLLRALRDVTRNPEWRFVREGPTWHGRRVAAWEELFA